MKILFLLLVLAMTYSTHAKMIVEEPTTNPTTNSTEQAVTSASSQKQFENVNSKIRALLVRLWSEEKKEDTFIGRCFGVARKLKMMIPIILIKLAVILTVLGFLTLFTLKGVGLLTALLFVSLSSIVSKVAVFFATKKDHHDAGRPQNIHFHIHPNKEGDYHLGHSSPGWDRWDRDKMNSDDLDAEGVYNLYKKLGRTMPYSRINYAS